MFLTRNHVACGVSRVFPECPQGPGSETRGVSRVLGRWPAVSPECFPSEPQGTWCFPIVPRALGRRPPLPLTPTSRPSPLTPEQIHV